ncbi:hypothetical protein SB861_58550, partial [Paraburkholderia sp. SIMBA_049]
MKQDDRNALRNLQYLSSLEATTLVVLVCVAGVMQAHWGSACATAPNVRAEHITAAPGMAVSAFAPHENNAASPRVALVIGNGAYGDRADPLR